MCLLTLPSLLQDNSSSQPDFKARLAIDILIKGVNIHKASHLHGFGERMGTTFRVELFVVYQCLSHGDFEMLFIFSISACLVSLKMDLFSIPGIRLVCHMVDSSEEGWIIPSRCEAPTMSTVSLPQNPRAPWGCSSQGGPWGWHLSWCDHRPFLDTEEKESYVSVCRTVHSSHGNFKNIILVFWHMCHAQLQFFEWLHESQKVFHDHPSIDLPSIWSWHWHISKGGIFKKQGLFHHTSSVFSESYSVAAIQP